MLYSLSTTGLAPLAYQFQAATPMTNSRVHPHNTREEGRGPGKKVVQAPKVASVRCVRSFLGSSQVAALRVDGDGLYDAALFSFRGDLPVICRTFAKRSDGCSQRPRRRRRVGQRTEVDLPSSQHSNPVRGRLRCGLISICKPFQSYSAQGTRHGHELTPVDLPLASPLLAVAASTCWRSSRMKSMP